MAVKKQLLKQISSAIPTCEELCKKTNGYFSSDCTNCIPPGGDPMAGSATAKTCMEKNCDELALARGAGMCPNDGFMECVSANTEVPALLQELSFVQEGIAKYASALNGKQFKSYVAKGSASVKRSLAQQLVTAIPTCEEMCKSANAALPGLADPACRNCIPAGASATSGSVNAKTCMDKNCDELALARGAGMCPNDGFMECVAANTEVPALIQDLSFMQKSIAEFANAGKGQLKGKRVSSDMAVRKQLVKQLAMYIPTCEEFCKKTNGYFPADSGLADPACRTCIPAGGNPLEGSEGGTTCHEKNCDELALQRGAGMCPNDG